MNTIIKHEIHELFIRMQEADKKFEYYYHEGFNEMRGVAAEAIEMLEFEANK